MSELHICHIIEGALGGTATHLLQFARYLSDKGIRLSFIISPIRSKKGIVEEILRIAPKGTKVFEIKMKRSISPLSDTISLFKIYKTLNELNPDIVHVHCSKAGALGRLAAFFAGIKKVVYTPHVFSLSWAGDGMRYSFYAAVERFLGKITAKLVVLNEEQKYMALEELRMEKTKVKLVYNAVDMDVFYAADEEEKESARKYFGLYKENLVIGMAARFEKQKGVFDFIKAIRLVKTDYTRVKILVAGDGSDLKRARHFIEKFGLKDNVILLGAVDDMLVFYHALDVFVLSSYWEGMPYSILEAQACGLAVTATANPGTTSIIEPGKTGKLAQANNPDSLAGAICNLLRDKSLREVLGDNSEEYISLNHNIKDWAETMAGFYSGL